jgi:hypothetical protein
MSDTVDLGSLKLANTVSRIFSYTKVAVNLIMDFIIIYSYKTLPIHAPHRRFFLKHFEINVNSYTGH